MARPGLRSHQRRLMGAYMRELANELGLRDWTLIIDHEPLPIDGQAMATCELTHHRRSATFTFRPGLEHCAPEEIRMVCIHELLHCHIDAWPTFPGAEQLMGRPAYTVMIEAMADRFELAVDALATSIAEKFHLPPDLNTDDDDAVRYTVVHLEDDLNPDRSTEPA